MMLLLLALPSPAASQVLFLDPGQDLVNQAACTPRPRVIVQNTKIGEKDFQVTLTAGQGNLELLRFGNAPNVRVDLPVPSPQSGSGLIPPFDYKPPAAPSYTFTVHSVEAGAAVTLPITVFDGCGMNHPWNTFVGGGQTATQVQASIADPAPITEGTGGTANLTFTVTLSGPASVPVSIQYATADGTATAPADYTTTTGALNFAVGEISKPIDVPIVGDPLDEPTETFTVTLTGATGATIADGTATGTIADNDTPPTGADDSYVAVAGQMLAVGAGAGPPPGLLVNDQAGTQTPLIVSFGGLNTGGAVTSNPAGSTATLAPGGSLQVNADGSFTFLAPTGFTGPFQFRYRAQSSAGQTEATVTIDVRRAPTANDDSGFATPPATLLSQPAGTLFNANGTGGVADDRGVPQGSITKFGGGPLGGTVDSFDAGTPASAAGHTLQVNADGSFSFTSASGFTGPFTFQYRLANVAGSDTATVTIDVRSGPNAVDDAFAFTLGANLSGDLNDDNGSGADNLGIPPGTVTSVGGGDLTGTVTSFPTPASRPLAGGTLAVAADGTISLNGATTPGTYTFQYRMTNAAGTDDATVTITVRQVPDAVADPNYSTAPNTPLNVPAGTGLLANDNRGVPLAVVTFFGGGSLAGTVDTNPAGPTAVTFGTGGSLQVSADGSFSFTPASGFTGTFTFDYRLANAAGSDTATVTIDVEAAPNAVADGPYVVLTGGTLTVLATDANDLLDNDQRGAPPGTVTRFGFTTADEQNAGTSVAFTGAGGTLQVNADGSFTVTAPTTPGSHTFRYRVANVVGFSDAVVTVEVRQVPDAVDDSGYSTQPSTPLTVPTTAPNDLLDNDNRGFPLGTITTFGGSSLAGTVDSNPAGPTAITFGTGGSLQVSPDGSFSFTPASGFTGTFTFQYRLANAAGSDTATVTIAVQQPPTAVADGPYTVAAGSTLNVLTTDPNDLLDNDQLGTPAATITRFGFTTADEQNAGTSVAFPGAGGTLQVNANGSFTITTPTTGGTYTFHYRLANVAGFSDATVSVTVTQAPNAQNDGPAPNSVPGQAFHTDLNTQFTLPANGLFTDNGSGPDVLGFPAATIASFGGGTLGGTVDTNIAGIQVVGNGHTLQVNANGSLTYTPASGFTGLFTVDYRLTNTAGSDTATITIAVGDRADANDDGTPTAIPVTGNVRIDTSTSGTPFSVGTNDTGDGLTFSLVSPTSANNGNVTINSTTGTFTYNPAPGFEGADTFQYQATNGFGSSTGTVNLNVSEVIWFVDASAPGGDGRLTSPFNNLAPLSTGGDPDEADDFIFVYSGSYTSGIALESGQRLIGQGANLDALIAQAPYSDALPGTGANPSIAVGPTSGTAVTLGTGNTVLGLNLDAFGFATAALGGTPTGTTTIGDATSVIAITAGNLAAGVSFTNPTGTVTFTHNATTPTSITSNSSGPAFAVSGGTATIEYNGTITHTTVGGPLTSIGGGHSGTITFQNGTLSDSSGSGLQFADADGTYNFDGTTTLNGGDAGIDILPGADATNGSQGTFTFGSNTSITGPSGTAFNYAASNGDVTYNGTIAKDTAGRLVAVDDLKSTGTITFTGAVSQNIAAGTGVSIINSEGNVTFANLDLGSSGQRLTSNALTLTTNTGTYSFTGLDIFTSGARGISATNGGTLVVPTAGDTSTIDATSQAAIEVDGLTIGSGGANFASVTSNGGANNVRLASVNGNTLDLGNGSLTGASQEAVFINIGTASVSHSGTITNSGAGIQVSNKTGGTVTFSGGTKTLNTGANAAVDLTTNAGATINFTGGGLNIDTTSGTGFNATGGGTVTVQGSNNTIDSTTGTALNVDNTNIGSADLTFLSINSNGGSTGIVLNNTGTTAGTHGGLTVTGSGTTDGSGGTIQNKTGRGASFITTRDVSLSNMSFTNTGTTDLDADNSGLSTGDNLATNAAIHLVTITNATLDNVNISGGAEQGINGNAVSNFTLSNSSIANVGNGADEDGIHFFNMTGTSAITNTTISGSGDDNLNLQTQSGTLSLTISGGSATGGVLGSGYLFGIRGTSNATVSFNNANSSNNFSGGIVADAFDNAAMNVNVTNSTSSSNNDQLSVSAGDNSQVDLDASGNTFSSPSDPDRVAVSLLGSAFDTGFVFDARLDDNDVTVGNGLPADGIAVVNAGGGTMNVVITNNTITYAGTQRAILVQGGQDGAGDTHVTITGNAIDVRLDGAGNAVAGILAQVAVASPSGDNSSLCADIGGAGALGNTFTHSQGNNMGGGDIRVRQRFVTTVQLRGYTGANNNDAAVVTYLSGRNTLVNSPVATATNEVGLTPGAGGFVNTPGGAACTQPNFSTP